MILASFVVAAAVGQFINQPQAPPTAHYMPGGTTIFESPGPRFQATAQLPAAIPPRWPLQYRQPNGLPIPLPPGYVISSAPFPTPSRSRMVASRR